LPVEWDYVQLTTVAQLESGHTPSRRKPEYWGGSIPWVSLHDTDALHGREIYATAQAVTTEGIKNSSARLLPKGTVVFSRTATVGKVTTLGREMATSQDFANYICGPRVLNHYLVYLFRWMAPEWKKLMAGSTHNSVYMPTFKTLRVVLPPRVEQEVIAEALSDADALIESLDQLINKKRDLKQGAMQELLTGKKRLPGFTGEWEVKRLGDLADMGSGGTPPSSNLAYYDGNIPWVAISDMTKGGKYIDSTERNLSVDGLASSAAQMFPVGTVLYAMYASLGECSIATVPLSSSQAILGIRAKQKLNGEFLYYFLQSIKPLVKTMGQQGTQANLNKRMVQDFSLHLPSHSEQSAIATILSDMDTELAKLQSRLAKARQIKQGMMQELLTGKTRLL
jgi:type I restriction enzyme S subunit